MSLEDVDESAYNARVSVLMDTDYASIQINKENINSLLLEAITKKHVLTNDQQAIYNKAIEATMTAIR
jgi:hypothetical protein